MCEGNDGRSNDYDYVSADPINSQDLDGKRKRKRCSWGCWIDRGITVTSFVPGLQGVAAGASVVRGAYKVYTGDNSGYWDMAAGVTFGAARGLNTYNAARRNKCCRSR